MPDPDDLLAFVRDHRAAADGKQPRAKRSDDREARAARAKVLDATADVLVALQSLLRATEEMVRYRSDRIREDDNQAEAAEPSGNRTRQRIDLTY